jgi:hypothetical protein
MGKLGKAGTHRIRAGARVAQASCPLNAAVEVGALRRFCLESQELAATVLSSTNETSLILRKKRIARNSSTTLRYARNDRISS